MMVYLFLANLYLLVFYGFYCLFLRKSTFFQWNRIYLLSTLALALTLPLAEYPLMDFETVYQYQLPTVYLGSTLPPGSGEIMLASPQKVGSLPSYFAYGYLIGCLVTALMVLANFVRTIRRLRRREAGEAFSFFGVVRVDAALADGQSIVQHERVHARQGHTVDLVLMQVVKVFNWFNPIVYCYERSLRLQHEYIADGHTAAEDHFGYAQLLVARAMGIETSLLTHPFSSKRTLKNRVAMLIRERSPKWSILRYCLAVPVVGIMVVYAAANNHYGKAAPGPSPSTPAGTAETLRSIESKPVAEARQEVVERDPQPPGGMKAFMEFVGQNYDFPQEAIEAGVNGKLVVSFVVEKDGSLSDLNVVQDGLGYGTAEAAIKLLQKSEKWSPAVQKGKKVRAAYTLPIRLNLQESHL